MPLALAATAQRAVEDDHDHPTHGQRGGNRQREEEPLLQRLLEQESGYGCRHEGDDQAQEQPSPLRIAPDETAGHLRHARAVQPQHRAHGAQLDDDVEVLHRVARQAQCAPGQDEVARGRHW
jgi:hypothetical protein